MYKKQTSTIGAFRFKHFSRTSYAVFNSLHRPVNIGVLAFAALTFAGAHQVAAQAQEKGYAAAQQFMEGVEVIGSRVPLTQAEAARIVTVLDRKTIENAPAQSVNDLLKYAAGIDVRQRGDMGIQTDISIHGGTFDQITILLNGVNITNPQTGHLGADFPVSVDDIERIEILEGAAARLFGTSAFSGAINIVTRTARESQARVSATGGSYGLGGASLGLDMVSRQWKNHLSSSFLRTDGATTNSDFDVWRAFYQGRLNTSTSQVNWQAGFSQQKYGANTFYSGKYPNQWEETQRYLVSVQAHSKLGWLTLSPTAYWNRSLDHYQLVRGTSTGENFHQTNVFGANLNAHFTSILGRTSFGLEMRDEAILSSALGKPVDEDKREEVAWHGGRYYTKSDHRTNLSYYAEHNILLPHYTLSLGVMANRNSAYDNKFHFYPGIDMSYRPTRHLKLAASWNMALRMPTFTDLYYKSPTQEGNVGLHPEETQSATLSVAYRKPGWGARVDGFYHRGKNMIDWVMYDANDVYHSANFKLDNYGTELGIDVRPREVWGENFVIENAHVGYTYIHQKRHDRVAIYKSNYALEYLRNKFVATLTHRIWDKLSATWSYRWAHRMGSYIDYSQSTAGELTGYHPYSVLDLRVFWTASAYKLYVEAANVTDHTYYDLGNVPQPGCWIKAGASWNISFKKHK